MIDRRPPSTIRPWYWMDGDVKTPGIGIFRRHRLLAHYTIQEARDAADRLHDLADQIEKTGTTPC